MDQSPIVDVQPAPATPAAPVEQPKQKPVRLTCPKHGDVTTSALYMTFNNPTADATGKKVDQFLYCLPCLNEVLLSLQKEGAIQQLQVEVLEEQPAPDKSVGLKLSDIAAAAKAAQA